MAWNRIVFFWTIYQKPDVVDVQARVEIAESPTPSPCSLFTTTTRCFSNNTAERKLQRSQDDSSQKDIAELPAALTFAKGPAILLLLRPSKSQT